MRRAALAALLVLAGAGACSSDDGDRTTLVSFNYCGNVCQEGRPEGAAFVVDLVESRSARVVMLQEVCRSQADDLRMRFERLWGRASLEYVTTFAEDRDGANRCADDDYGMAILAPSLTGRTTAPLPNPGLGTTQLDERTVLCADVGSLVACTTHLARIANDEDAHAQQVDALIEIAIDLATGEEPVVLAGDLNDSPQAFAALIGPYVSATPQRGVDQVYATSTHFESVDVDRSTCECSDHDALAIELRER